MKNKTSYLSLMVQQTFGKVLAWVLVVFALQAFLFYGGICRDERYYYGLLRTSFVLPLFLLGVGGIYLILMLEGSLDSKTHTVYSWMRLSVSMGDQMALSGLYYIGCFLIFLAVEALLLPLSWSFYSRNMGSVNLTEYYQAIYRYGFFHALCPLADLSLWIRNAFYVGTFALEVLVNSWEHRFTGRNRSLHVGLFLMIWFSQAELGAGGRDLILTVILAFVMIYDTLQLRVLAVEGAEALVPEAAETEAEVKV